MFRTILRFELAYHLKRPVTYLYFAVLFMLAFGFLSSEAILIGGGVGLVRKNSPFSLTQTTMILIAIGQVITTALVGTAILRDFNYRAHELLYTTRMTRWGYLGGRFFGAFLAMLVVYLGIPLGALVGTMMPWVDADKLLPINLWHYFQPFLLFGVTNLLLISAIFFAVGALTRNIFAIYVQGILLLVAYSVSQQWLGGLDKDAIANATDPFGMTSFELTTRYWTVVEKNTRLLSLDGLVLTNRLIWLGVTVLLGIVTYTLFRFEAAPRHWRLPWRKVRPEQKAAPAARPALATPAIARAFDGRQSWRQFISEARFSFLRIVKDMPFLAIAAIGAINHFMSAWYADSLFGETTWPVTYLVAQTLVDSFVLFMIILTTIYAGEAVWRERSLQADQITDALPVSTKVTAAGKIVGVILSQIVLLLTMIITGLLVQTFKGYYQYEPLLYLKFLFGATLPWVIATTLFAFFVHSLVNNKFVGHLVIIVYWVFTIVIGTLGFEHQLYMYGQPPDYIYSDMNGFGHFKTNMLLSAGYWNALGLMLATAAVLFWARGTDDSWRRRVQVARERWRGVRLVTAGGAVIALVFGTAMFYNTNILNRYRTSKDGRKITAEFERTYRRFKHLAPPRITDIDLRVDLEPERRAYRIGGRYIVRNEESTPIDSIVVNLPEEEKVDSLVWSRPFRTLIADSLTGTYLYALDQPLAPGDSMELRYVVSYAARGFPNSGPNNRIVANGTFLSSVGPSLGYNESFELDDEDQRKKEKLPPKERLPDLDDPAARRNSQFSIDSDAIRFAATVSTAPDQIAVAPGDLEREWTANGRRFFRYVMNRPMSNFATVVSARYVVKKDRWKDIGIEVYHHPGHTYNVDRMIDGVKASLDYYTTHFSPYQYKVIRIVEFPRYATFAQSFPTTVPYSEGIGFILRVLDQDDDLDMPFWVTAHEVAHQWWGHQVVGANVQGSAMMVESMAEYAALTVMEKKYGPAQVQKFLRYELDRYLRGRASERRKELPLIRSENQAYIHYSKGSLVLYALRDYIGEAAMNRALQAFITKHAFEKAPYSTSRDFVAALRLETPDSLQYTITDLIETITIYDNKTEENTVERRADGKYVVKLNLQTRKFRADSVGVEKEIPIADYIDIGVFGEKEKGNELGKPLYLQKHRITAATTRLEIVVDEMPKKAGVDPYNKLIDRVPQDNVKDVPRVSGDK